MKKMSTLAALALVGVAGIAGAANHAAQLGYSDNVNTINQNDTVCGTLVLNADGTYENGYAWFYGGIVPPNYGAFAECYNGNVQVCAVVAALTQIGYQSGQTMDVYVWQDGGGIPGNVACVKTGVNPGPIAFWPSSSVHNTLMDNCCVTGDWWVGTWANWPNQFGGWYNSSDESGFGGCPMTNFAPGIGYPTGWGAVNLVYYFSGCHAMGLGAETIDCGPVPVESKSWGEIKNLYN